METRTRSVHGIRFRPRINENQSESKMAVQHGKEKFYGLSGKSQTAFQKRNQQLQVWERSETNKEPEYIRDSRRTPRVKFDESVIFLAAVQSSDMDEVERLIQEEGADVNCLNKDGLTALHQVCIIHNYGIGHPYNVCPFVVSWLVGKTLFIKVSPGIRMA